MPDSDARTGRSTAATVEELAERLSALGTPARAEGSKKYLKSSRQFYGTTMPDLRRTVRAWLKDIDPSPDRGLLLSLAGDVWQQDQFEMCMAAVEILRFKPKLLQPEDLSDVEDMVRKSLTWALVDPLAIDVAGTVAADYPADTGQILDRWAGDADFWVRRTALLSQLKIVKPETGDARRFLRYADEMLDEKEFFIRKAIGWVLREMSRNRPGLVVEWMLPRAKRASGVTMREVVRHLPEDQRAALLAAR